VGVPVVREMFGMMAAQRAQRAIIVTSGTATEEARNFASGNAIVLIEDPQLAELIRVVQGLPAPTSTSTRRHASVISPASLRSSTHSPTAAEDAKSLGPQTAGSTRACPRCGAAMALRITRQGPFVGQRFYGCANFLQYRATEAERGAEVGVHDTCAYPCRIGAIQSAPVG